MRELFDHVAVSRQQDPDVAPEPKRAGQGRRNGGKAAHPDEVVHFGRNEQNSQKMPSCQVLCSDHARMVPVSLHCEGGSNWGGTSVALVLRCRESLPRRGGPI